MDSLTNKTNLKNKLVERYENFVAGLNGGRNAPLNILRREALGSFITQDFPTFKHEEWKYTNVNFLNKYSFEIPLGLPERDYNDDDIDDLIFHPFNVNMVVFVNGFYSDKHSKIITRDDKICIRNLEEVSIKGELDKDFGNIANFQSNPFVASNTALGADGAYIEISDNADIEEPVHLLFINDSRENSMLAQPKNFVKVGNNARFKMIESVHTLGEYPGFTNSVTEFKLGADSIVHTYKLQNDSHKSYYIGTTHTVQQKNSKFNNTTVTLNGTFVRNDLNSRFEGEFAEAHYNGIYFLQGDNFVDNHTLADHAVPNCHSNESYKGILDDDSTAVFNGKIMVRKGAQKTNAFQSNKNVLLTDRARIFTKPQLEIYADDVKCSHGATSGSIDPTELFYLRSRGIPEEKAKSMLLFGFISQVLDRIKIEELRKSISEVVQDRLGV